MEAAIPLTVSTAKWSSEVLCNVDILNAQHSQKFTHANCLKGGISERILFGWKREDLNPQDMGIWQGEPFAAIYVDDVIKRSNRGLEEGRLQVLTFCKFRPSRWPSPLSAPPLDAMQRVAARNGRTLSLNST